MKSLGIYIHIPVCENLCGYCDFYSVKKNLVNSEFWNLYYRKLVEEFRFKEAFLENNYILNSIYFGGGTPSLAPVWFLNNVIEFILDNISRKSRKIEISLEANPETISPKFLDEITGIQINRLSVGIQSLSDNLLNRLERIGSRQGILRILGEISNGPIENWNADIIYGIPGQSTTDLIQTIQTLISYDPKHISAYELTLHSSTHQKVSESIQLEHQEIVWDYLPAHGFRQYEISNFARPGYACFHNVAVWKYRPYMSLGTSGHSFLGKRRFRTIADIDRYLKSSAIDVVFLEDAHTIPDLFITTLRLGTFQGKALFKKFLPGELSNSFDEALKNFSEKGWIDQSRGGFTITREGLKYSNSLLEMVYEKLG